MFRDYIGCRSGYPVWSKSPQGHIFCRLLDLISSGDIRWDSLYTFLILQRENKYQVHNCYSFVILEKRHTFPAYSKYNFGSLKRKNTFRHHRCYSFVILQRPNTSQECMPYRRGCPAQSKIPQQDNHRTESRCRHVLSHIVRVDTLCRILQRISTQLRM
jgi:hypothetical protein